MILSDKDIRVLCTQPEHPLISPFDEFRLQGASYDVSMSDVIHVFKDDVRTISLTDQNTIDSLYKEVPIPDSSSKDQVYSIGYYCFGSALQSWISRDSANWSAKCKP